MAKERKQKRARNAKWKPSSLPYETDYNDHFETPESAYRDILPLLDFIQKNRNKHVLYDPFYCDGRVAQLLKGLGFSRVIHQCRDFYNDVENNNVPRHDTFITNPPYSDDHKERCFSFALEQLRTKGRPFFILVPNYVAARDWFRRLLVANPKAGVAYVIPSTSYEYDHPEGTGHAASPFDSMWFCGLGAGRVDEAQGRWNEHWNGKDNETRGRPRLVTSLNELERLKLIPTEKRPNPRQRRKRRKRMNACAAASDAQLEKNSTHQPAKSKKRKSRHRNEKGERKRRRF